MWVKFVVDTGLQVQDWVAKECHYVRPYYYYDTHGDAPGFLRFSVGRHGGSHRAHQAHPTGIPVGSHRSHQAHWD